MELANQVALVTGASRGIGRSTAIALAEAGADVAINFRSHVEEAQEVADIITKLGRRAILVQADVSEQSAVEQIIADTAIKLGRVDVAVSNAAYSDREPFHTANMAGVRRTVDVTMWGAYYLVRAAANQMLAQGGGGSIIVVSSPHAVIAAPRALPYNMSKAAIDHMARTAAIEMAEHRIRVNIVHPGWIDTPGERKFASDETIADSATRLPWGRLGRPDEVGRAIVFLASPLSDYITGSTLAIEGGIMLPWWANRGSAAP